jgi:two-component system nitrate/nitrite sensor histidine kinase NarX
MPLAGATLYGYEPHSQKYKAILNWRLDEVTRDRDSIPDGKAEACACFTRKPGTDPMSLQPCRNPGVVAASPNLVCFCIPFFFSESPVGGARLYFLAGNTPSREQYRLLKEIAPKIAAEFQRIQLELTIKRRKYSLSAEQQRIARDVHDTLGHSLAFLRLRLDHISMEFDQPGMDKMRKEVEALRDVAKEAYDQMREVLNQLNAESDSRLSDTLNDYADKISQRASFEVEIEHAGQQRDLPPLVRRNVLYIFREILTNVEKHAQARHVGVKLKWQPACLEVEVQDDGVGFNPQAGAATGHFGIRNMQDRADEIRAQFSIASAPRRGTRHMLRIPYEVSYEINRRGRSLALSQWSGQPF